MRSLAVGAVLTMLLGTGVTGCIVAAGPPDYDVEVAPPLPVVVDIAPDRYYYHRGYYYYYHDDGWRYSRGRRGPWRELPRSHWPHEVRHRGW